jgi:hypothetical protein
MLLSTPERQDLSKLGLQIEEGDLSPTIPPQLVAGVQIPFPLRNFTGTFGANPTIGSTVILATAQDVGASAAASTNGIVTFRAGIWRVQVDFHVDFDFNVASPILSANSIAVRLISPGGIATTLASRYPQTLVVQEVKLDLTMLLVDDLWVLRVDNPATAVGQTFSWVLGLLATRLL